MIPDVQAAAHRAAGTLIDLAPTRPVDAALYWQQWKLDSPALAAVAEAVARTAARHLAQPGHRGGSDRAAARRPATGRAAAR